MNQSEKQKKILIINVHSSENAGDMALLEQTIFYLRSAFINTHISICSNWPNEEQLLNLGHEVLPSPWRMIEVWNKNKKPRKQLFSFIKSLIYFFCYKLNNTSALLSFIPPNWKKLFSTFMNSDLIVAVSGNQLFSSGKYGWPLPVIGFPIFLGISCKKPVVVFPQSIGPFRYSWERLMVRYLYNRVTKLFIRDFVSLDLVKKMGIRSSRPEYMPDIAFSFPAKEKDYARKLLKSYGFSNKEKKIGITILSKMPSYINQNQIEEYYFCLSDVITKLVNVYKYKVFIFNQVVGPTEDENDAIGVNIVLSLIPSPIREEIILIDNELSPALLKGCYGLMDLFIATRLHSGIFALDMRVPTLFIGYLDKTIGVLKAVDLDKYFIRFDEINSGKIIGKLMEMENQKEIITADIDEKMCSVGLLLEHFPEIVREIIDNGKDKSLTNN